MCFLLHHLFYSSLILCPSYSVVYTTGLRRWRCHPHFFPLSPHILERPLIPKDTQMKRHQSYVAPNNQSDSWLVWERDNREYLSFLSQCDWRRKLKIKISHIWQVTTENYERNFSKSRIIDYVSHEDIFQINRGRRNDNWNSGSKRHLNTRLEKKIQSGSFGFRGQNRRNSMQVVLAHRHCASTSSRENILHLA